MTQVTQPRAKLRVAVAGLGWWGRIIVPLLKTSSGLEVVRVVDPDPKGREFASQQGIPFSSRLEEALVRKGSERIFPFQETVDIDCQTSDAIGSRSLPDIRNPDFYSSLFTQRDL